MLFRSMTPWNIAHPNKSVNWPITHDVASLVTFGFVGQFDGIVNAGLSKPFGLPHLLPLRLLRRHLAFAKKILWTPGLSEFTSTLRTTFTFGRTTFGLVTSP
jgi:hypothetical protein